MLTEAAVEQIVREFLPDDTKIVFTPVGPYLFGAIFTETVQRWLQLGIYQYPTLRCDFLGWACTYAEDNEVTICLELLHNLCIGLTEEEAETLVRFTAAHEAHHLTHHCQPVDVITQLQRELECEEHVERAHPELAEKIRDVYDHGEVYRRVFARARAVHAE